MHHPALAIHRPGHPHRQAGLAHRPGLAAMDDKPGGRPGFKEPGCAGVEVDADEVQGGAALVLALEGQSHIHQPGRQFGGKTSLEQPAGELGGQVAVHGGGAAGAHPVAEDHLGRPGAAKLLHRIPRNIPPGGSARCAEHRPQQGPLGKDQGGDPLAGEFLGGLEAPAADPPHLLGQGCQLRLAEPGPGQGDGGSGPAQIVQGDGALQGRHPQGGEKGRHPPRFVGLGAARRADLVAEHREGLGHRAVLLGQGAAHRLCVDPGLLTAAVEGKGPGHRPRQGRRVDAPGQLAGQVLDLHMLLFFQNGL